MGTNKKEHPNKGEVIYEDDTRRVICRRWNWRDCEQTKITSETKNAIINMVVSIAARLEFLNKYAAKLHSSIAPNKA